MHGASNAKMTSLRPRLKELNDNPYIGAFLEYLIVTIGFCPLYLYLFVELKWFMLNKYGWDCLFLFNTYTNWLLAGMAFATISCVYWLIVHLIQKESKMFYLLEKKKKEIYEL